MKRILLASACVLTGCTTASRSPAGSVAVSLTVEPVETLDVLPDGRIHIVCNTGAKLETKFEMNGKLYQLTGCDLPEGRYIDTICTLTEVAQ